MNIFHIPSWYPNEKETYSGIFIKEMIEAYAEMYGEDVCYISNFHQLQFEIALKKPFQSISKLFKYATTTNCREINYSANFIEFQSKIIAGNKLLFGEKIDQQLAIVEEHFQLVLDKGVTPDIIHAHVCYPAGFIAYKLSLKHRIPYVISEQTGTALMHDAFEKYHLKGEIMDAFNHAAKISALSKSHLKEMEQLSLNNICLIPNLVNETVFKPVKQVKNKQFVFFSLALIVESKGINDLIFAICLLVKQGLNFKVIIGGEGEQAKEFKKLATSLNLDNFIQWVGRLSRLEASEKYQQCDCFVLPSKGESLGVVYLEAIACGKPIIATNCGGPADIVNDINGLLVDVGNIDAIANAMVYIMKHGNKYDNYAIREDFLNRFSRQVIVKKIKKFYEEVITLDYK